MNLTELNLRNFRNYEEISLEFDPGVNLIVGQNAQGKTNLLEAIGYLGSGKSFRAQKNGEMVRFDTEFADFEGETVDANTYKAVYPAAALLTNGNIDWWETKSDYFVIGAKATKSALGHQYAVENDIPCEVSLEERMGCGIGACLGCAIKIISGEESRFGHVCKDGPVFNAKDVEI